MNKEVSTILITGNQGNPLFPKNQSLMNENYELKRTFNLIVSLLLLLNDRFFKTQVSQ